MDARKSYKSIQNLL